MKFNEVYTYIFLIIIGYLIFKILSKKYEYFTIGGPCTSEDDMCMAGIYCAPGEDLIDCCDGENIIDADISRCSNTDTICLQQAAQADIICAGANNDCNIHEDCNGDNAVFVTGTKGNCDCSCNEGYEGSDCSTEIEEGSSPPPPPPPPSPRRTGPAVYHQKPPRFNPLQPQITRCNQFASLSTQTCRNNADQPPSDECCAYINDTATQSMCNTFSPATQEIFNDWGVNALITQTSLRC